MSSSPFTSSESEVPISKSSLMAPESPTPMYLWFLQVLIVWGATAVVIWLSLTPKTPIYSITDVRSSWNYTSQVHNSSSFTIRNMSSSYLIININISNPNKRMGVYFDYVHLTLNHSGATIGSKYLPGFFQGFKWTTSCKVVVNISDQQFVRGVAGAGGSNSTTTDLRVGLETAIQYKIFRWKTKHHFMDVAASIPIGSDGRLSKKMNITTLHHERI